MFQLIGPPALVVPCHELNRRRRHGGAGLVKTPPTLPETAEISAPYEMSIVGLLHCAGLGLAEQGNWRAPEADTFGTVQLPAGFTVGEGARVSTQTPFIL